MKTAFDAAVKLRTAAVEFVNNINEAPRDARDSEGLRRDRKLLRAAIQYAKTQGKKI